MKIKLLKPVTIEGKTYPCNCVIDIYQPEWEAMIADGTGVAVPDGTMARLAAYDAPGCVPPQGPAQQAATRNDFTGRNKA